MQNTSPITPTVWLVVDGSSSMNMDFENGTSRWQALRSTLMEPGGVVDSLQALVRFGMVIYAGGDGQNCVQLISVEPELNNLSKLSAMYPMQPVAMGTPTDKALEYVVNNLPVLNTGTLDGNSGPVYVVLATDGSPNDNCGGGGIFGGGGGGNVEQKVVNVTAEGTSNGMQMFVISLAGGDDRLQTHLADVAMATKSKTPPFVPSTRNELISAFQMIVGGASCLVSLNGEVETGKECTGTVRLNSEVLRCNETDGWMLFNPSTVQLVGAACQTFTKQQSMVIANFPCEIFSPN
ncbi:MAG TPA: vWA domain-containing protein [Polyangiales bacterium]|nr:vWA domain-containing protein [Polyangiales bacterium]